MVHERYTIAGYPGLDRRLVVDSMVERVAKGGPSETSEQIQLFKPIRRARLAAFAVPNGGSRRGRREGAILRASGVEAGVSDVLVVAPPAGMGVERCYQHVPGTALELKRSSGTWEDVSEEQREWLVRFASLGWLALVGYGFRDALAKLRWAGYVVALLLALVRPVEAVPAFEEGRELASVVGSELVAFELQAAGYVADVDPLFLAAVTWVESRWRGRRDGDGGASVGLWQITASAVQAVVPVTRSEARALVRLPVLRSIVAGLYWRRLIERYGRPFAAAIYTCGPRCRGQASTRTSRAYWRAFSRLRAEGIQ